MGALKKVSVILTTFNAAEHLQRTLRSILNQDGAGSQFELELIVVDDCSTDDTHRVLDEMAVPFLTTTSNSGGPNQGRNIGLDRATGDYICISDHDDVWMPDKVITLLPYLEQVPIVTSGYVIIDTVDGSRSVTRCTGQAHLYFENNATFLTKLTKSRHGQHTFLGSIMYSSALQHIRFEEKYGMVDYDWITRLFHQQASIEVCRPLYERYVHGRNLSYDESYRKKDLEYSLAIINSYREAYPRETRIAYRRIHGTMARYYYVVGDMSKARYYFRRSGPALKTLAYYLTTFVGSGIVKRLFKVF
ncbi:MAG: glycosyltransferase family 2 protein [Saprospiraceae bacterium]|nr:glycosyltransferase family 2 protein [Saprospiraceae bacterium]